jgi:hypothetical protein
MRNHGRKLTVVINIIDINQRGKPFAPNHASARTRGFPLGAYVGWRVARSDDEDLRIPF